MLIKHHERIKFFNSLEYFNDCNCQIKKKKNMYEIPNSDKTQSKSVQWHDRHTLPCIES